MICKRFYLQQQGLTQKLEANDLNVQFMHLFNHMQVVYRHNAQ